MTRFRIVTLCGLLTLMLGCSSLNRLLTGDPFYYSTGDWDSIRLPLVEPYQATDSLDGTGWEIAVPFEHDSELQHQAIRDVAGLAVQHGVVMVEARGFWFALIPSARIQRVFNSREELDAYVSEYSVTDGRWGTPDDFYAQFRDTGCLDWVAACQ